MSLEEIKRAYDRAGCKIPADVLPHLKTTLKNTFVLQEHKSKAKHFDLRYEQDGVFKSFALPKGMPKKAGESRLAIKQPDHSLEYGLFEGEIPKGEYGAGQVKIIDFGKFSFDNIGEKGFSFRIDGEKYYGKYILIKLNEERWLLKKIE